MAVETELKLLLPPDTAGGILRRPALRNLLAAAPETIATAEPPVASAEPEGEPHLTGFNRHKLESTYYDTADQWLSNHRMALRVRRIGRKRIQTLKVPAAGPDGLQNFQEIEAEIAAERPVLAAVTDAKLSRRLERNDVWRRLRPIFQTRFQRAAFLTEHHDSKIEVAVDLGSIVAGGRRLPIAEIELELKSGAPGALYDLAEQLALQLAEDFPIRLGAETKAGRGYALAEGREPEPHKAKPIVLAPEMSTEDAFVAIVGNCLDQLRANEEAVLSTEDDEAIHQFRVALRRLRAIVSAYRDLVDDDFQATISIDLRWMQRQFGPARDLDVLIAETLQPIHHRLRGQAAFDQLIETGEAARTEARRAAHLAIENPRYVSMLIQCYRHLHSGDWRRASGRARLGAPAGDFARPLLQSRHKRLMKLGTRHQALPEPELHRLRLLAKKMRYAAEAFHSLYKPKPTRKYVASLTAIQDSLGSLNDAFVSRQLLSGLAQRLMIERGMAAADANLLQGLVLGWQTARIDRDLGDFAEVWRNFAGEKRFWNEGKA
jgi:inorganic triphosphatase YgiF